LAAGAWTGAAATAATVGAAAGKSAAATAGGGGGHGGSLLCDAAAAAVPPRAWVPEICPTPWAGGFGASTAELFGGLFPCVAAPFDASAADMPEYRAYKRLPADRAVALATLRKSAAAWARAARMLPTPPPTTRTDLVEVIAVSSRNRWRDVEVVAWQARAAVDVLYAHAPHHCGPALLRFPEAVVDAPPAEGGSFGSLMGRVAALLRRLPAAMKAAAATGEVGGRGAGGGGPAASAATASASDSYADTKDGEAGTGPTRRRGPPPAPPPPAPFF